MAKRKRTPKLKLPELKKMRAGMMVWISIITLAASLFVVVANRHEESIQKWATGMVGFIVGFWLRR